MHPYVILQLLRLLLVLFTIIIMNSCQVDSQTCNAAVRTIRLYSSLTNGHVRVDDRKVVAKKCDQADRCVNQVLQTITMGDDHSFLLYDKNARMFICWNRSFSNVKPRRNPKDVSFCKFTEQVTLNKRSGMTRYTTTYNRKHKREAELKFNRFGNFSNSKFLRKCLARPRREKGRSGLQKLDMGLILGLDTLRYKKWSAREEEAYGQRTKYCADPDFLPIAVDHDCRSAHQEFCKHMKEVHEMHGIAAELQQICKKEW